MTHVDALTRRGFATALSGTVGAAWVLGLMPAAESAGDTDHAGHRATPGPDRVRALEAIADRIIPATAAGPGAREAGAIGFITRALDTIWHEQRPMVDAGLAALDARAAAVRTGATFADLAGDEQDALLREVEAAGGEFFPFVRLAALAGTFGDPSLGGNRDKLGWRLIGFEDRFAWEAPFGWYDRDASAR